MYFFEAIIVLSNDASNSTAEVVKDNLSDGSSCLIEHEHPILASNNQPLTLLATSITEL